MLIGWPRACLATFNKLEPTHPETVFLSCLLGMASAVSSSKGRLNWCSQGKLQWQVNVQLLWSSPMRRSMWFQRRRVAQQTTRPRRRTRQQFGRMTYIRFSFLTHHSRTRTRYSQQTATSGCAPSWKISTTERRIPGLSMMYGKGLPRPILRLLMAKPLM